MKNHIVSQLIIKRFANAINVFDVETGKIDLKKRPDKVFYKNDRLPQDLDNLLSTAIESRFANILYKKLITGNTVELTRKELNLVKRYLLMTSVRTYSEDEFWDVIHSLAANFRHYSLTNPEVSRLKSVDDLGLTPKQFYELTLRVICENEDPNLICFDKRVTSEIAMWARPFAESYLAIWDASKDMEYILSDCSMVSEYEGVQDLTGGLSLSKVSYLQYQLVHTEDNLEKIYYIQTLAKCSIMYENYNVFNLSSTRSLILINPFFRQYFKQDISYDNGEGRKSVKAPDMWPSVIQNKELFRTPINRYAVGTGEIKTADDIFVYEAKTLSPEELVYINSLIIFSTHDIFGFNKVEAIKDSVDYSVWARTNVRNGSFLSLESKEEILNFVDDFMNSALMKLSLFCNNANVDKKVCPFDLFRKVVYNILKDFDENKYIYWYLLNNEKLTRNHPNLIFLGDSDKRIMDLKAKYQELWGEPYDK